MNDFDNKQICSYKDIDRFGFTCDVCGRKVNGCHYINGMSFCEKCYQETFGKDNQQNEIQQLKQQLAEKDKEIAHLKEKDNYHLRYELAGADETITNLKQQLAVKGQEINIKNNKLAELKKELTICKDKLRRKTQSNRDLQHRVHNVNTQLAIQELEKVKNKCNGMYELWLDSNYKENMYNNEDIAGVFEDISVFTNDLIKKLKGE